MSSYDIRSIIDIIRDAKFQDLIIISIFLWPILFGAWSIYLNSIDFLNEHNRIKAIAQIFLVIVYVVGIIWMKKSDSDEEKLKRARYHIETRLKKRGGHRASFDAIRNEVNKSYTNNFIEKVIDLNPEVFGKCTIKKGNKQGITLTYTDVE